MACLQPPRAHPAHEQAPTRNFASSRFTRTRGRSLLSKTAGHQSRGTTPGLGLHRTPRARSSRPALPQREPRFRATISYAQSIGDLGIRSTALHHRTGLLLPVPWGEPGCEPILAPSQLPVVRFLHSKCPPWQPSRFFANYVVAALGGHFELLLSLHQETRGWPAPLRLLNRTTPCSLA